MSRDAVPPPEGGDQPPESQEPVESAGFNGSVLSRPGDAQFAQRTGDVPVSAGFSDAADLTFMSSGKWNDVVEKTQYDLVMQQPEYQRANRVAQAAIHANANF